jgi:Flp pilus assembly protein TadD
VYLCVLAATGCTARQSSLKGRFVKHGKPSFSYDLPTSSTSRPTPELTAEQRREIAAHAGELSVGRTVEATNRVLSEALRNLSTSPTQENFRRVADAYRRLGILDKAYDYLTVAIEMTPRASELFEARAYIWRDWNLPGFGLSDAHRAVHIAPRSASARTTLGRLLLATGDLTSAREQFEKAVDFEPTAAYALNNLCYLSILDGSYTRAESECRRALAIAPQMTAARNNLALSYASLGDMDRARAEFLLAGDSAAADFNIGIYYMANGDYTMAAQAFRLASNARPALYEAVGKARQAQKLAQPSGKIP